MNNQVTIAQLQQMKLKGMAEYYQSMETLSPENRPTLDLFMAKMVEAEIQYRNRKRTEMYLRTSRLRYNTVMEDVICSEERNLTRQTLQELADCDFIPRAQNLLITGRTGCGKSFLACALGRQAMAKVDGTLLKVINHIEKNALVIFDDFGLQPLDDNSRLALLQILEDCYERKSVIITSQLPVAKWYDYIKEPTLADAIMDRLTANARRIVYLCTRNYDLKRGGTFETAKAGTFHSVTAGTSIPLFTT